MKKEIDWKTTFIAILVKGDEKIPVLFTKEFGVFPLYRAPSCASKYGALLDDPIDDVSEYEVISPDSKDSFMELVNNNVDHAPF